ncbi:U32 family peptidase C-terminal domain-containing protein [Patescibacteria group bacterium]|nr:U32 family peptidase C-terminal domain-containing protein [Patescibacteria group bacterium]
MKNRPELLVPAGSLEKLKVGLQYGADAFYLGIPAFSMRSRITNFTTASVMEGVELIRKAGKKFYITTNIYPRGLKVDAFKHHIEFLRDEVKPDAVIVADDGVFDMFREYAPKIPLHISVQANLLNYRAVQFWQKQGASRVILPRELTLDEIRVIHEKVPEMELEAFVHGAICVSYSGRCLLSAYMTGRDANQGACAHSCRWKYRLHNDFSMGERVEALKDEDQLYLEEEKRPGEFMPIEEDEHGTYIMNSRDMCLLPFLKELTDAGICSFKVEGRNKTEHYLGTVTRAYRQAIDDMMVDKELDESLLEDLHKTANRGFIPGFMKGFPGKENIYYEKNAPIQSHKFIGIVKEDRGDGLYVVEIRNKLERGEVVEVMMPDGQFEIEVSEMFGLDGEPLESVHGGAGEKLLKLKEGLCKNSFIRIKI